MFIDSLGLEAFREDGILGFGSTMLRLPAGEITLADYSADFSRMLVKDVLFMRCFMNDEELGKLLEKMAYFYCSIPVAAVRQMILDQYPEVTPEQLDAVLMPF